MITIKDIKPLLLYKKQLHLPFNDKDKLKGSAIILVTPSIDASIRTMMHPLLINKYHTGYYIEKDITYFINNENVIIGNMSDMVPVNEGFVSVFGESSMKIDNSKITKNDYQISDNILTVNIGEGSSIMIIFNDSLENEFVNEGSIEYNSVLRKLLYDERFRTPKEVILVYNQIKQDCPFITKTFIDYKKYMGFNLFVDFYYYNQTFFKNNIYKLDKGVDLYMEFLSRFINDKRLAEHGYNMKHVIIPVDEWNRTISDKQSVSLYTDSINPISMLYRMMKTQKYQEIKDKFKDTIFLFTGANGYFKIDFSQYDDKIASKFLQFVNNLADASFVPSDDPTTEGESTNSIVTNIIDKIENSTKININNLTGDGSTSKDEIVAKVQRAALTSKDSDEAIQSLDNDEELKKLLIDTISQEDNTVKLNAARSKRMSQLQQDYYGIKVKGTTIKDILDSYQNRGSEIPQLKLDLDTPNEEWKNLTYPNFEKHYSHEADIMYMMNESFQNRSLPVAVRDLQIEDSSTSEDYIETWIYQLEDGNGKRFTIKMDIPKIKDDCYMILKGNEKSIVKQLLLLPIVKTDSDTVQIVSNYNKIFLVRFGNKMYPTSDRLIKFIDKLSDNKITSIKVTEGDCSLKNSSYNLPIDYDDLGSRYIRLEDSNYIFYFNQDEIRKVYNLKDVPDTKIPYGYDKRNKEVLYATYDDILSKLIVDRLIKEDSSKASIYDELTVAKKYCYTRAMILNAKLPLIVVLSYSEGLFTVMKKANIKFDISEKRPKYDKDTQDIIKFNDAYILYDLTYESSLLMNGLKECNTEDYSIKDANNKSMWLDFLDIFGTRLLADGIENFYESMIDKPITYEVLKDYNLPTDYTSCLLYANELLADTDYVDHTYMPSRRLRSNEVIAAFAYKAMCESYEQYRLDVKNGKKNATMTMKQSAVIGKILEANTISDHSTLNAIQEAEELNTVSYKGYSGMNNDRSYGLDKRGFDPSMINILGLSTNVGPNVGINRQATIDCNIQGKRGYIKSTSNANDLSVTKGFTVSEGMTPYGTTRDDPPRSSMKFIQDKHSMRAKGGSPMLITNGTDEALPYIISNTFAYKAKEDGEVIESADNYLILKYKSGKTDVLDLRPTIKKNSNGGFYTTIQLETKLKKGSKFKETEILAVDPLSFSNKVGFKDTMAYCAGVWVKFAILQTDEGFEDSAIISEWLSKEGATEIVIKKDITLGKNAEIYSMAKVGQPIQEGESLLTYQNSYAEADVNSLLRNLVDDEGIISDLGRIPIKSKVTGSVEGIKAYRTVELEELSPSLRKKIEEIEKPHKELKNIMKKYNVEYANRYTEPDYKLAQEGKLKGVDEGVLFEFYLKYYNELSVGDKITFFVALKGIIKDIFPEGLEPYTDFRPTEKLDALLAIGSVNARMIASIKIQMIINKILVELSRTVKDILGIKYKIGH